jgi:hypothetical protein
MKLVYQADAFDPDRIFIAYSDADHAGVKDNGRSTGGYIVRIGGGAVS